MKNGLITPTYVYIRASLGLPNSNFQCLPTELQHKIIGMLNTKDVISLAQCSRRFLQVCSEKWVWENMLARYFPTRYIKFTIEYNLCYQFLTLLQAISQYTEGMTESALLKWFTLSQSSEVIWHPLTIESVGRKSSRRKYVSTYCTLTMCINNQNDLNYSTNIDY